MKHKNTRGMPIEVRFYSSGYHSSSQAEVKKPTTQIIPYRINDQIAYLYEDVLCSLPQKVG